MDILLGGLVSVITLAIVKAFEIWQKSKEHKYSMQATYFQKKLEAAEAAIVGFQNELSFFYQYVAINELFENAKIDEYPFLLKKLQEIIDDYSQSVEHISNSALKVYLYYDLEFEENYIENKNYKRLIELFSEINNINNEIGIQSSLFEYVEGDKQREDFIFNTISEKAKEYLPKFTEMNNIINDAQKELLKSIKTIKKDMKKYNYK